MNPKFGHKHYLPILKSKAGERWAIQNLTATHRNGLTPLWEIHESAKQKLAAHIERTCSQIHDIAFGQPFFIDLVWLQSPNGSPQLLHSTFDAFRTEGAHAIPTVRLNFDIASLDAVKAIVQLDQRGYLLRLAYDEVSNVSVISSLTNYLGVPLSEVHLLLDYGKHSMDLPARIALIPSLQNWRTFSASSGVFPSSISHLPRGTWNPLPRYCWQTWETAVLSGQLPRKPSFSDYSIRDPGKPAEFGVPSTNVRYASETNWMAQIRGKLADGMAGDIRLICQDLAQQPFYSGAQFSEGDRIFSELAKGNLTTGAGKEWVQWSSNHHLAFVSNQIQTHAGI